MPKVPKGNCHMCIHCEKIIAHTSYSKEVKCDVYSAGLGMKVSIPLYCRHFEKITKKGKKQMITKRLTARDETRKGNAYFPECFKEPCCGMGCEREDCTFLTQVCEKLAYYEDKYPITEMPAVDKMPAEKSKGENK